LNSFEISKDFIISSYSSFSRSDSLVTSNIL
jgi:hypothetical protein